MACRPKNILYSNITLHPCRVANIAFHYFSCSGHTQWLNLLDMQVYAERSRTGTHSAVVWRWRYLLQVVFLYCTWDIWTWRCEERPITAVGGGSFTTALRWYEGMQYKCLITWLVCHSFIICHVCSPQCEHIMINLRKIKAGTLSSTDSCSAMLSVDKGGYPRLFNGRSWSG